MIFVVKDCNHRFMQQITWQTMQQSIVSNKLWFRQRISYKKDAAACSLPERRGEANRELFRLGHVHQDRLHSLINSYPFNSNGNSTTKL